MFVYYDDDLVLELKIKYYMFRGSRIFMFFNSMDKRNINEIGWFFFFLIIKNVRII